jgi:hypothetical protein
MKTSEILAMARALIANEKHWCQGSYAARASGGFTDALDPEATQWCALGACIKVTGGMEGRWNMARNALYAARRAGELSVVRVNDKLGHAAVMHLYDKAIEMAIAEELINEESE